MKDDPSRFTVGDDWAYRQSNESPSERVRIIAVEPKKNSARLEIRFLDDPNGRVEKVPGSRLRAPWSDVGAFDALMANWRRIDDLTLDPTEEACVEEIFLLLISEDVAELLWSPISGATDIHNATRLSEIINGPLEHILASAEWFDHDGRTILSPAGTLRLVEAACHAHPTQVLDLVNEQEAESRHKCKFGRTHHTGRGRDDRTTTPEWEYDWYRRHDRPRHELLRQWCGHRAVTHHERFLAFEAENHRLDILVTDLLKALDSVGAHDQAAWFAEEHERDRITPHTIRPIVERPLDPSEIPVREITTRRRWW